MPTTACGPWSYAVAAALVAWLVAPRSAHADALLNVTLHWSAPAACADAAPARAQARSLLPPDGAYEPIEVSVTVEVDGSRQRVTFHAQQGDRLVTRLLHVASCEEAQRAAGLLLALTLDPLAAMAAGAMLPPEAATEAQPPEPPADIVPEATLPASTPIPTPTQDDEAPPPEPAAPPPAPERARAAPTAPPWALDVALALPVDVGALPVASAGAALSLWGTWGPWAAGLGAGQLVPLGSRAADGEGGGHITAALTWAELDACRRIAGDRPLALLGCGGFELGRYVAGASGVENARDRSTLWIAARSGLRGRWRIAGPWALELGTTATWPLSRPVLAITGVGSVYTVPPVTFRGMLSLIFAFGR